MLGCSFMMWINIPANAFNCWYIYPRQLVAPGRYVGRPGDSPPILAGYSPTLVGLQGWIRTAASLAPAPLAAPWTIELDQVQNKLCLLYTSDAADDLTRV